MRFDAYTAVREHVFESRADRDPELHMHAIVDRVVVLPAGKTPMREAWHRDEAPFAGDTEAIYGGWLNLDACDQLFSCVPGTHQRDRGEGGHGFAPIAPSDRAEFAARKEHIRISPGHLVIFHEDIVHEVIATKFSYDIVRVFVGFAFGPFGSPLIDRQLARVRYPCNVPSSLADALERKCVVPIKSGQCPSFYPKITWLNATLVKDVTGWDPKHDAEDAPLDSLATAYVPDLLIDREVKFGGKRRRLCAPAQYASLYGASDLPDYAPCDCAILYPHRARVA